VGPPQLLEVQEGAQVHASSSSTPARHDAALNCRRESASPPPSRLVRIKGEVIAGRVRWGQAPSGDQAQSSGSFEATLLEGQPDHHWCMYCRRPTVFRHYKSPQSLSERWRARPDTYRDAAICGASARIAVPESTTERFKQSSDVVLDTSRHNRSAGFGRSRSSERSSLPGNIRKKFDSNNGSRLKLKKEGGCMMTMAETQLGEARTITPVHVLAGRSG
jgi:hypothetical protein